MTMICGNCNQAGIRWMGPMSRLTHTECPHCGGTNCQRAGEPEVEEEPLLKCGCGEFGEANYFADDQPRFVCGGRWCMP